MIIQRIRNGIQLGQIATRRLFRRIKGEVVVHVFGDSHSLLFKDPCFQIHYIGSATAYRLGAVGSTNRSREKVLSILDKFPQASTHKVLFVFGEIDCRVHIYKAAKGSKKSLRGAVDETVENYISFLKELRKRYKNIKIIVFNVLPQGEQGNYYRVPHYANRNQRMEITKMFNKSLKKACMEVKIKFVDIFNQLVDKTDRRIKEYIFDDVHYNIKIVPIIIENLKEQGVFAQ